MATEKEVFDAHQTLAEGNGDGNDFLGWLNLPVKEETEEIRRIRAAAFLKCQFGQLFSVHVFPSFRFPNQNSPKHAKAFRGFHQLL